MSQMGSCCIAVNQWVLLETPWGANYLRESVMNPLGKTHVPLVTWRVNLDVLLADSPQLVHP